MSICYFCNQKESIFFKCRQCNRTYCTDHRLPENHNCKNIIHVKHICHYCGNDAITGLAESHLKATIITGGLYDIKSGSNSLPFRCNYCKQIFCIKHRLPEAHNCYIIRTWNKNIKFNQPLVIDLSNYTEKNQTNVPWKLIIILLIISTVLFILSFNK